jgi:hypothetical protein
MCGWAVQFRLSSKRERMRPGGDQVFILETEMESNCEYRTRSHSSRLVLDHMLAFVYLATDRWSHMEIR